MGAWRRRRRSERESRVSKPRERQSTTRARAHGARAARGTARCEKDVRRDVERSVRIAVAQCGRRVGRFLSRNRLDETWLRALLASHAVLLSTVLIYRKSERIQGALFCACTTVVLAAERLNALGNARWESFAGQNYFGRERSVHLYRALDTTFGRDNRHLD